MAEIKRPALYGKLTPLAHGAVREAVDIAEVRGHARVELAQWLQSILLGQDSDLHRFLRHFKIDEGRVVADLAKVIAALPRNEASRPVMSGICDETTRQAWVYATLMFGSGAIRTGHLLIALLKTRELTPFFRELSEEWAGLRADTVTDDFEQIVAGSPESEMGPHDRSTLALSDAAGNANEEAGSGRAGQGSALARFTVDLTEKARKGEIDPIVGRDWEIRQLIDILQRRRQNNPVLVGEAGVGKTAVVEGFAHRLVAGDVPLPLKDVVLRALDVGLLQAGASMKGEFEQRLRSVIEEVQSSPRPIILFIDEVHTLIGAGGQAGTGDAANLLKPALARGSLRTIAATTWDEYRKHIEKDPALSRRFQQIFVAEPTEARAIQMLRSGVSHLEQHHRVQIFDEAVDAAVRLSVRFLPARQLPDKAVSLLDTAAARVAVGLHAVPARVEDCRRRIHGLELEHKLLSAESRIGLDHSARLDTVARDLEEERSRLADIECTWNAEKELVNRILELRAKLRASGEPVDNPPASPTASSPPPDPAPDPTTALQHELRSLQDQLASRQGDSPLLFPAVDRQSVAAVISEWTGIPVGRMARQNIADLLSLATTLEKRVIGQRHALELVAGRIHSSRARLENPERPIGVFLFVGPSGTGKTETALALAESLYGGEQNLITINMAEFQEKHTVSTLKGAPPGYVGYGEGGVLTEAVRRRPYSVVLLDEVEKAHADVHKIFFQVFDKGYMEDSEGRSINFRNCVIILTSNAAQETLVKMCADPKLLPTPDRLESALRVPLTKVFPDALLNRLVVVPYYPISKELLERIIHLGLSRVSRRISENHRVPFSYDPEVVTLIARRCSELERGARMIETLITNTMLPVIGQEYLARQLDGRPLARIHIGTQGDSFTYAYD